jgi:hypothetical protein
MTVVEWEGIPEQFWPDTDKPWRVQWGFGVFEDFETREEAQEFYKQKLDAEIADGGGWDRLVRPPFNAVER